MNGNTKTHPYIIGKPRKAVSFVGCFLTFCLWLIASPVYAVGLGDISSSSFLGQPLKAVIEINPGRDNFGINDLKVRQLNHRQASDISIELAGYYRGFQTVIVEKNGKIAIELTSRKPLNEPFLNIVIELIWHTGKVYREYTLLIDPIVLSTDTTVTPRASSTSSRPGTASIRSSSAVTKRISTGRNQSAVAAKIGDESYRVQSGDNLSKIASQLVAGSNTRRRPMMQWLVQKNPQAFVRGDMDRLKAGALLALPENQTLNFEGLHSAKPRQAKAASVKAESSQLESEDKQAATAQKPDAKEEKATPAKPIERLSIVTPNARTSVRGAATSESELVGQLQNQLATTNEVVEQLRLDNKAMRDRLESIEKSSYVDSLERLVLLKEKEITGLQQQVDNREKQSTQLTKVEQSEPAQSNNSSDSNNAATGGQRDGLIALLIVSLLGAAYFFYRWRVVDKASDKAPASNAVDEETLLKELDQIIASRTKTSMSDQTLKNGNPKAADVIKETQSAFGNMGTSSSERRGEDEVKKSIQEKTNTYSPPEVDELERAHHDELDQRISEAIDAANRGAFDIAEALLLAEQAEQARLETGRKGDPRLDVALQYIDKLRKGSAR